MKQSKAQVGKPKGHAASVKPASKVLKQAAKPVQAKASNVQVKLAKPVAAAKPVAKPDKTKSTNKVAAAPKSALKPIAKAADKLAAAKVYMTPAPVKAVDKPQVRAASQKADSKLIQRPQSKPVSKTPKGPVVLPPGYAPSDGEPFMNEMQRAYFKNKLMTWKEDIIKETKETLNGLHEETVQHADLADRATSETDRSLELRARDRQRKLVAKIDAALSRIEDGSYGYCEETGEPIGIRRLDARPIATLSLEAQERHERRERVYREE
jgi:DnaK suppressor protein